MSGIYNKERMLERTIENIDNKNITTKNKELIKEFISFLAANGVGKLRQEKYIFGLEHIAEWLNIDFDKANKQEIQRVVGILENKDDFTEWTKHDYKVFIKKFYNWLRNKDIDDIDECIIQYKGREFLLIHDPKKNLNWNDWIVHGHHHNNHLKLYPFVNKANKTVNVSVELTDYKPISLKRLLEISK